VEALFLRGATIAVVTDTHHAAGTPHDMVSLEGVAREYALEGEPFLEE
jgi:hypothetical protein